MKLLNLLLPLAVIVLFSSGCMNTPEVGSYKEFKESANKVSFDTDHSYEEIASILNKYAYKCLNARLSFNGINTLLYPSISGNENKATLSVQFDDGKSVEKTDNERGFYALYMDIEKLNKKSVHVIMYEISSRFKPLYNGVKAWMEGRRGCPDLIQ